MKLSICVDAVFMGMDTVEAMKIAKRNGYDCIEFWAWWNKDIDAINAARKELNMRIVGLCTKMVSLTDETARDEYIAGLKETLEVCKKLDCKTVISQVGSNIPSKSEYDQSKSIIEGLKASVPYLEKAGVTLVIEPLNITVDHIGYYLWSSDKAAAIIDAVGSKNVKMLFDLYHQQIMEGNITSRAIKHLDNIGHMHCAGCPGRHEIDTGEVNYNEVFKAIAKAGYDGCIGFEYFPLQDAELGIKDWSRFNK